MPRVKNITNNLVSNEMSMSPSCMWSLNASMYFAKHFCEVNTYDYTQGNPDLKYVYGGI